jgi:hypothetical protein
MTNTAVVFETNNLSNGRAEAVVQGLERLFRHLGEELARVDEVVVTHDGLDGFEQARVIEAAGRDVKFAALPLKTGYYAAKNVGFDATTARFVAFADSDCWPVQGWLEALFAPLLAGTATVAAGRTCYRDDTLGAAATTIDFMYFDSPLGESCTRNFYANNVAFERQVFERARFEAGARFYRGDCQVLGLVLQEQGVKVLFVPRARTTHRFPDTMRDFVKLRMHRGADAVALAPHLFGAYFAGLPAKRLGRLAGVATLAARWAFSVGALNHQGMTPVRGLRKARALGAMTAISALDVFGALTTRAKADTVLSYHRDVDRLGVNTVG